MDWLHISAKTLKGETKKRSCFEKSGNSYLGKIKRQKVKQKPTAATKVQPAKLQRKLALSLPKTLYGMKTSRKVIGIMRYRDCLKQILRRRVESIKKDW
jgi:hypothetical protein